MAIDFNSSKWKAKKTKAEIYQEAILDKALKEQVAGMGAGEAFTVGAGRTVDKMTSGVADIADALLSKMGSDSASERRYVRQTEQEGFDKNYEYLSDESPVSSFAGEMAPYAATIPFGGGSAGIPRAAHLAPQSGKELLKFLSRESAIGAVEGAAHYDDTALEGAGTGLAGAITGKWMGDLFGGKTKRLVGDEAGVVKFAKDNKLFLPPGMATGAKSLQQMDQALKTHRLTADKVADKMNQSNIKQNNMIADELGGEKADYFTDEYLDGQRKRISGNMDDLVKDTSGEVTEMHASRVDDIINEYSNVSVTGKAPPIMMNQATKLEDLLGSSLSGDAYQNITRSLRKQASNQYTSANGDRLLAKSLNDIADLYDDVIEGGVGAKKSEWREARRQFALLSSIQESKDVTGNISATDLAKKFKSSDMINNLAKVDQLRKKQAGASLGTSGLLGKMIPLNPADSMGAASLLSGRVTGGVLPAGGDLFSELYLSGYPHVTGLIPGSKKAIEKGIPRLLMARDQNEN